MRLPFRRKQRERELEEELSNHLRMAAQDHEERGEPPHNAETIARMEIGNISLIKEVTRNMWGWSSIEKLGQDLRFGLRMLVKNPTFTCVAVLCIALGIGANTAIFSIINGVLLHPLPFESPERLVAVFDGFRNDGNLRMSVSLPEFVDYREQAHSFEQIAAWDDFSINLGGADGTEPERIEAMAVTANLFSVLRASPLRGRFFLPEEEKQGNDTAAIISYGLWQRRYGGDPNLVGRQIMCNSKGLTVVGILPRDFAFQSQTELWTTFGFSPDSYSQNNRGHRGLSVIGRLKPGISVAQAQSEMDVIAERFTHQYPNHHAATRGWTISLVPLLDTYVGDIRTPLLVLFVAVMFVLLIACANVANLLLARASGRRREIAVRLALGAKRIRVARQLITESVLLSIVGGIVGLIFAKLITDLVMKFAAGNLPRASEIVFDPRVLMFAFGVSLITGIVFGLAPALQASKPDVNDALKDGGRSGADSARRRHISNILIVSEIALALVLLIGSGLVLRSFVKMQQVDPGFNPDNVLTMRLLLPYERYQNSPQRVGFYRQLLERVSAIPGIQSVGAISRVPMTTGQSYGTMSAENSAVGPSDSPVEAEWRWATPDALKSLGVKLIAGRYFADQDGDESPQVAVVDETFARRFYPNENPIGKRIKRGNFDSPSQWLTVVGVVGHVKTQGLDVRSRVQVYYPYYQDPDTFNMSLVVKTASSDPLSMQAAVRGAVGSLDRNQPVYFINSMRQIVADSMVRQRLSLMLMGAFAAIALILASAGIYGVIYYSVAQRTQEIGVRMALGAQQIEVLKMIIGQGMVLTSTGVLVGVAGAFLLTRLMSDLLFQVEPTDPITFISVSAVLAFVALTACFLPARRATRIDPMVALRYE